MISMQGPLDIAVNHIAFMPPGYAAPQFWATVYGVNISILGGVALLYCLYAGLARKEWTPLLVWLGGFPMTLLETFADLNGHIWYPENLPGPAMTSFETRLPLLIALAYCGFSVVSYAGYVLFRRGASQRAIMTVWGGLCVVEALFEFPLTSHGSYTYYGFQPLKLFGYPLWWAWINGTGFFTIAFLIWLIRPLVRGWKSSAIVATPFLGFGFAYGFLALPNWISLNYPFPVWLCYLFSIGSLFACFAAVKAMAALMASDRSIDEKSLSTFLARLRSGVPER